eukprot:gnl/MRDRNA2_/MRDRNA2_87507_c0_seq1.p1 gnl/MRDRNA2_/MRDRNA2_87507_c0~~gnl/MRDRNA2_/MRDRNA2_87507_c0_seq1.p1  ORF type:complete len:306 (+),score=56.96 gnl/MRDRNA2_/MRDRNA2_87507_c0_seq1:81-920(+)
MSSLQICAPWDDRLWSLLKSEPTKASKQSIQIINDNLVQRRKHRVHPNERSGTDQNPLLSFPLRGTMSWSGCYVEIPMSVASIECKVQYDIVFKPDGTIEGSGSSAEGNFKINGSYNLQRGIVAWRQAAATCPVWYNPCSKYGAKIEAEFFGRMLNFSGSGPARITGTFLTDLGRYCAVNLTCPTTSGADNSTVSADAQSTAGQAFAEMEQLPTLLSARRRPAALTGKWQPLRKEDNESACRRKQIRKQATNTSDTYHSWEDQDEDEDDDEAQEEARSV